VVCAGRQGRAAGGAKTLKWTPLSRPKSRQS
jgi:hypothetical protein